MKSFAVAAAAAALAVPAHAADPADSWLVYAKAAGQGSRVLSVNATWTVPAYPTTRAGGNAPGWWFGIEPNPADVLIQPILAYGDGTPDYTIFTGFYDWHDGNWVQSTTQTVTPGQQVLGSVTWREASGTYQQCIQLVARNAKPICTVVSKANEHGETFTDVYFVVEHQPNSCAEYPSNGNVVFDNIQIAWESGAVLTPQSWTVAQYQPACNSNGTVVSASSLKFTWDTS